MPVIEVNNLSKRFRAGLALDNVSFRVERGEIFGLVGPNGSGKTVLAECIEGRHAPDHGTVAVLGLDPSRHRTTLRQRVAAQLPVSALPDTITVWEALDLFCSFHGRPADWRPLLEGLGLVAERVSSDAPLTAGQRQRLTLALVLAGSPEVVILDNPTTGLDPCARRRAWDLIEAARDRGTTVLLVTHVMEEAERLCDRVAVLDAGRIVGIDSPAGLAALGGVRSDSDVAVAPGGAWPERATLEDAYVALFAGERRPTDPGARRDGSSPPMAGPVRGPRSNHGRGSPVMIQVTRHRSETERGDDGRR